MNIFCTAKIRNKRQKKTRLSTGFGLYNCIKINNQGFEQLQGSFE